MRSPIEPAVRPRRSLLAIAGALAGVAMLVACTTSSAPAATPSAPPTSAASGAATAAPAAKPSPAAAQGSPAATGSPAAAQAAPAAIRRANANTATIPELQQALESAGVPNAARWAREVDEYRPYPTDDLSFGKLRQNLAKYNPAPDVVEKIISALTLT